MRVLLDECLPRGLKKHLRDHEVSTVPEAGWTGKSNGELLQLIPGKFHAFVTVDSNLVYQQNVTSLSFGVVVIQSRSNRLANLVPLVPELLEALETLTAGQVIKVGG